MLNQLIVSELCSTGKKKDEKKRLCGKVVSFIEGGMPRKTRLLSLDPQ